MLIVGPIIVKTQKIKEKMQFDFLILYFGPWVITNLSIILFANSLIFVHKLINLPIMLKTNPSIRSLP